MPYTHVIFFKNNQHLQNFLDAMQSIQASPPLTVVESHKTELGDPFVILRSEDPWSQQEHPLVCQFEILFDDFNQPHFNPKRYGTALAGWGGISKYEC